MYAQWRINEWLRPMSACARIASALWVLSVGWPSAPAFAEDVFQVDTAPRYAFPLRSPSDHFATRVSFDPNKYTLATVSVQPASSGPGGSPFPPDGASVSLLSDGAVEGRQILQLAPLTKYFRFPGEYRIVVRLVGESRETHKPIVSDATLSIVRAEPQLDIDSLSGKSTTLYRQFPWAAASGQIEYSLQATKASDAAELFVAPLSLDWVKSKEIVPNAVVAISPASADVTPEQPRKFVLKFSRLEFAGDFETFLVISSDNLSKHQVVTVAVHVKDYIWLPLLVILLGVFGGALVSWMSGAHRVTLQTRYRLSELRLRLQKLGPAITTPASATQYQQISEKLDELERASTLEQKAEPDITKVTSDIAILENTLAAEQGQVTVRLDALDAAVAKMRAGLSPELPDIASRTQSVISSVAAVRAMNAGGQIEYAKQQVDALEQLLQSISGSARAEALAAITHQIAANAICAANALVAAKLTGLQGLPATASLDNFVLALNELRQAVRDEAPAAFQAAGGALRDLAVPAAQPPYAIRVITSDENRLTGQNIEMEVTVVSGKTVPDKLVWCFDSGAISVIAGSLRASQSFDWPGTKSVSVQLYLSTDLSFHQTMTTSVLIRPGQAANRVKRAEHALQRNEILVMTVAILLAAVTGLLQLYFDKPFGSAQDYIIALLWGFGVEKSVRGFNAIYSTMGPKGS